MLLANILMWTLGVDKKTFLSFLFGPNSFLCSYTRTAGPCVILIDDVTMCIFVIFVSSLIVISVMHVLPFEGLLAIIQDSYGPGVACAKSVGRCGSARIFH